MSPSDREWGAFTEHAPWVLDRDQIPWTSSVERTQRSKASTHARRLATLVLACPIDPDVERKLNILRSGLVLPAPTTPGAATELNEISTGLSSQYGKGKGRSMRDTPDDEIFPYASEDADITLRLHRELAPRLAAEPALERVYRTIEMPLVPVLERIEANGVMVDAEELRRQTADLSRRMLAAQQKATELAGRTFNLDSPKQLCALLFEELKLPALVKTPKGQPSTNEEALEALADQHELPRVILEYRGLAKLRSTYTEKLPEMINPSTGRVHTSYHQAGAATGRQRISAVTPLRFAGFGIQEGHRSRAP